MRLENNLTTGRLLIEDFTLNHLSNRYVSWLNDPIVTKYSEQRHLFHTQATCHNYFCGFEKSDDYFLAIMHADQSPVHIGNITVRVDRPNLVADISILLGERSAWGKGLGTEAWEATMKWLLYKVGMRKVIAGTMSANTAMLKIMKKSGMTTEAVLKKQFILSNSTESDLVIAARFS